MSIFDQSKEMHTRFGINYQGPPRELHHAELAFRVGCLEEEQNEYIDAEDLEEQYDALLDLMVFAAGTIERQGFKDPETALRRVMRANNRKRVAGVAKDSRRDFAIDLVKPAGWRPPYLGDLSRDVQSEARGIILLEGPDHSGKSTLGEFIKTKYDAHLVHSTWSKDIASNMERYLLDTLEDAIDISRNQLVVLDRSWLSDKIYAHVYRNGESVIKDYERVRTLFSTAGVSTCLCFPDNRPQYIADFYTDAKSRNEMYMENMEAVYDMYALYHLTNPDRSTHYDYHKYPLGSDEFKLFAAKRVHEATYNHKHLEC